LREEKVKQEEKSRGDRKNAEEELLRKVTIKIGLERIDK